ncbi:MAG: hypothetical protein ACLS89_08525 [Collinsella sp.]
MKDQTSKTAKNRASALGKAKAAALSLFGAGAVCLASARPAYAVDVNGPSFNYMITQYVGPGMTVMGFAILVVGGYNYFNYKDEEGPKAKAGLAGMVGGGIMAAIGGGAVLMSPSWAVSFTVPTSTRSTTSGRHSGLSRLASSSTAASASSSPQLSAARSGSPL